MKLFYNKVSETMKGRVHPRVKPNGKDTIMNKILIAGCTFLAAFAAVAMPNKKELAKAQRLVDDVTKTDLAAIKAGTKQAKDVADIHVSLAGKAENQAEKYLLYQGAFKLYARCEQYDLAADALLAMSREVGDVPPEVIVEVVGQEMRRVAGKKAPRVLTIFKHAKRTAKYRKEIAIVEKSLKAKPHDTDLNRRYGECLAELGRWKDALPAFAKAAGEVSKIASGELSGKLQPQQCADFWWEYNRTDDALAYKSYAAELYCRALTQPNFGGLQRQRAEDRIAEAVGDDYSSNFFGWNGALMKDHGQKELVFKVQGQFGDVTFEFVPCQSGSFEMGYEKKRRVSITRQFWMSKAHFSKKQWRAFWDMKPGSESKNYALQQMLCGAATGDWFETPMQMGNMDGVNMVLSDLNKMLKGRLPKGYENYVFRLPTEAEWEYAVRFNSKDPALNKLVIQEPALSNYCVTTAEKRKLIVDNLNIKTRFGHVSDDELCEVPGPILMTKKRSWFGVCDVFNGRSEVFLDRFEGEGLSFLQDEDNISGTDVFHWTDEVKFRSLRRRYDGKVGKFDRPCYSGSALHGSVFRIVLGPDLVSEWKAKHKNDRTRSNSEQRDDMYVEIDLSAGKNAKAYPTRVVRGEINANTDEYKTNKLLLKYVKPGKFMSGDMVRAKDKCKEVTIQDGFMLGVFEVTQRQWELVMGNRPSFFTNATEYAMRPVESVTRSEIEKDKDSFINRLKARLPKDCGIDISLPYATQWEFACRAGTQTDWYNGKSCLADVDERQFYGIGRCRHNGGWSEADWGGFAGCFDGAWTGRKPWMEQYPSSMRAADVRSGTAKVGSYQPNAWGFYDMLGNVSEHCAQSGCRGGNVRAPARECLPTNEDGSGLTHYNVGFRIAGQISPGGLK